MARVAVLGIGRMGGAIAEKVSFAGHDVSVWNRTPGRAEELAARIGVAHSLSAHDAVAQADLIISMLSTGKVTTSVLLDEAVLDAMDDSAIVCDMATSGAAVALELDGALRRKGFRFIDAPVSGSVPTVMAGQLLVMASGDEGAVREVEPVLRAFAKRVAFVGAAGAGQSMKLSVNLIVHTLNSALAEALALAESGGVSREDAYGIFSESVIAAPFVSYKRAAFLDDATPVAMSLDLTAKDLELITSFARDRGVSATVADAVLDQVRDACDGGWGSRDMADLVRFLSSKGTLPQGSRVQPELRGK
jgi:3-hydroxyisobutyrate dehydrogenase